MEQRWVEYFEARVERIPFSDCWFWTGAVNTKGYGQTVIGERAHGKTNPPKVVAHRFSYELYGGLVPEGLQLDHLFTP